MNYKKIILIGIVLFGLILIIYIKEEVEEDIALEDLNLKLYGIVSKVTELKGFNGTGIIQIDIITSNIKEYHPDPDNTFYYCIIKNGVAEIFDGHVREIFEGDTININTADREISWKNIKGEVNKAVIWVNNSETFINYMKNHRSEY